MNINEGKQLYSSYAEAEKVAMKMRRNKDEGYQVYKVGQEWAVGGVHTKVIQNKQKIKSFDNLRLLLDEFRESENDFSVEEYISEIKNEAVSKTSTMFGDADEWILRAVSLRLGRDLGMSISNNKTYLVLDLEKGSQKLMLKMGGNFSRHIPLIKKQADSLVNFPIIWYTWNNKTSNWGEDAWFYRIEEKFAA